MTQLDKNLDLKCPACGISDIRDEWRYKKESKYSILWCRNCGFGWRNPFPNQTELKQFYKNHPVYGLKYRMESGEGFPIRLQRLSYLSSPDKGKMLDIGSGLGFFLKLAQEQGWEIEGIEPSHQTAQFCYKQFGIKVHTAYLENFYCSPGSYNVVTLWDVLEHASDFKQILDRSIELLSPGGILAFSIPNASGWPARIFRGGWRYVMPVHLNYFKMNYIRKELLKRKMHIEFTYHTIKIHSLIQGILSYCPSNIFDMNKIFNLGYAENRKNMNHCTSAHQNLQELNILNRLRKFAYKLNMKEVPFEIGDLVDIYCRKT